MKKGFTLIELSIVLVIIGLIVGGVLVGQDLIKAAQLRSVVTDYHNFQTAVNTFKLKYDCTPGDCDDAELFFGTSGTCPGTAGSAAVGTLTCNGDGDGKIDFNSTYDGEVGSSHEHFRFWQQLGNADLINGQYTGVPSAGLVGTTEDNAPSGDVDGSLWYILYINTTPASYSSFFTEGGAVKDGRRNYFRFGAELAGSHPTAALLENVDAFNIDSKIDDGAPGLGIVKSYNNTSFPNCADSNVAATAAYQLTVSGRECAMLIQAGF